MPEQQVIKLRLTERSPATMRAVTAAQGVMSAAENIGKLQAREARARAARAIRVARKRMIERQKQQVDKLVQRQITQKLKELQSAYATAIEDAENACVRIALTAARSVVGNTPALIEFQIATRIRELFHSFQSPLALHAEPTLCTRLQTMLPISDRIQLIPDPSIEAGTVQAMVDSGEIHIDWRIEMEDLTQVLLLGSSP